MLGDSIEADELAGSLASAGPDEVVLRRGSSSVSVKVKRQLWELHVAKCRQEGVDPVKVAHALVFEFLFARVGNCDGLGRRLVKSLTQWQRGKKGRRLCKRRRAGQGVANVGK